MEETTEFNQPIKKKESVKDFLMIAVISLVVVFLVRTYVAQPFIVSGESMEPTFHTGEYLIVDQISYKLENPKRGDVVIFRYPVVPSKFFIKRIIGLPKETVKIEGYDVFIKKDGASEFEKMSQDFIEFEKDSYSEITLGATEYFVMGDNRLKSLDSRIWGPLERDFIVGKALMRLFPLDKVDLLPGKIN